VIALLNLKPVMVDVDIDSFNITPEIIEKAITNKTRAVVPVNLYGQCADLEGIRKLCDERGLFMIEDNAQAIAALTVPQKVKDECAQTYSTAKEQALCQRMALAGRSVALMIQDLDHDSIEPKFETPETSVVRAMNFMHPYAQCRLDTYFNGAICPVPEHQEFSDSEETEGSCHPKLGDTRGNRPRCWFLPRL
jgi:O-acetylhomoserine/O-acetylserine sulfhydrylase-like pyridoxal-dependent enzyme